MKSRLRRARPLARVLAALALVVACSGGASAGDAPAPDPLEGLLARDPAGRVAAARAIGAGDLEASAPAVPMLVEALDDEDPAARAAAKQAIVDLASKAAPLVVADLAELAPLPPGAKPDVLRTLLMLGGGNWGPQDLAFAVEGGANAVKVRAPDEFQRIAVGVAALPAGGFDASDDPRATVRMLAVETGLRKGIERATLARALALAAWERTQMPRESRDAALHLTPLSAEDGARLARALGKDAPLDRTLLAAFFISKTGLGGDAVVPGVLRLMTSPLPGANESDLMDPARLSPLAGARAAAVLARTSTAAASGLGSLSPDAVEYVATSVGDVAGATPPWRAWLEAAPESARISLAVAAAWAGCADDLVLSILTAHLMAALRPTNAPPGFEGLESDLSSHAIAAEALGRLGTRAESAIPTLAAYLAASRKVPGARTGTAVALLRISPGHAAATAALVERLADDPPTRRGWSENESFPLRGAPLEVFARNGGAAGLEAARAAIERLLEISPKVKPDEVPTLEVAIRALAAAPADAMSATAALLARLLAAPMPFEDGDGSASALVRDGKSAGTGYRIRGAALDALGRCGVGAKPQIEAVRLLLESRDPRLRWRAAQALRRMRG